MDSKLSLKQLQDKKKQLLQEQERLISELRNKYPDVHKWFIDRKIDLTNLGDYASKITAALALVITTHQQPSQPPELELEVPAEIQAITRDELRRLKEPKRAQLVWERYGGIIHKTATKYNIDPNLIFATIMIESGGDAKAIRHEPRINDASYGLGQILYGTARGIGFRGSPTDLFDPEANIDLIGKYHRRNQDTYDTELTPAQLTIAYNTGSPYKRPWPGHLKKFYKWYNRAASIEMELT